jgi:REP element-mobilizing transposase RayT
MANLEPLYTRANCSFAGPLRWGLTVFWRTPVTEALWLHDLSRAVQADGLKLLGHRFQEPGVSQFSLSTLPDTSPLLLVNRLKGRLQYLVRSSMPKPFQRNYALRGFGPATRQAVESYVASQLHRHPRADERVQAALQRFQRNHPEVDLSRPRSTSHGIYWYNLHVVLVHEGRWAEVRPEMLEKVASMIERVCRARGFSLSRAGILPDHVHLALGCPIEAAPAEIALTFLNNLAYVHGMTPVFQFGAYLGTFGEYHQGAVVSASTLPPEGPQTKE